jgi:thioredoxin reductase (NADPH)
MTAALYLLRAGVKTAMIEKLAPGGQVLMTSEIENYPGFPKGLQGWELADKFANHLEDYDLHRINDEVRDIKVGSPWHTIAVGEEEVRAKTVVLATGSRSAGACPIAPCATAISFAAGTWPSSGAAIPPWRKPCIWPAW